MPSNINDYHKAYEQNINSKIENLKNEFKFVYHIMHPFEINKDGDDGLYNEKLENEMFDYKVKDIIIRHFGTIHGISDESSVDFSAFIRGMFDDSIKLSDVKKWWVFKKDGVQITKASHPLFIEEVYALAAKHFKESEEWNYYTDDDHVKHITWEWKSMSWAELCKKFSIEYDDSLRLSRINEWMRTNGHPKNIRQPKEMINSSLKESIQNAAENVGIKLKFITDHDMFVTLIGTDKKISKELNKLGCEFLEL